MKAWARAVAIMAFGTHELEIKLGLVRENYEFGFGPIAFERLAGCPHVHVQLADGEMSPLVEAHWVREQSLRRLCF